MVGPRAAAYSTTSFVSTLLSRVFHVRGTILPGTQIDSICHIFAGFTRSNQISLAGLWVGAVLYGLYLMLFGASVYILVRRNPNKLYLAVTITLFIFTTATTLVDFLNMLLTPLMTTKSKVKGGALVFCADPSLLQEQEGLIKNLINPIQIAMLAANTAVADGLLIYRAWILWGYNKWIVMPLATILIATALCNMADVGYLSRLYVLDKGFVSGSVPVDFLSSELAVVNLANHFSVAATILSLVLTIITTVLITSRLWVVAKAVRNTMGRNAGAKYHTAIAIIVESGALYAVCLILNTVADFTEINGSTIISIAMNHMLSIAPTLVIVRVGMGKGFETVQDSVHTGSLRNSAVGRNVFANGGAGTVSALHFRTVQDLESETSSIADDEHAIRNRDNMHGVLDKQGKGVDEGGDVV